MTNGILSHDCASDGRSARRQPWSRQAASSIPDSRETRSLNQGCITPRPIFVLAERLVQIRSKIERLLTELRVYRMRIDHTRAYLSSPWAHDTLARAYLEVLTATHERHLRQLRHHRRQAWRIADELNTELSEVDLIDSRSRSRA
jgi:hypothetical protein